MCVFNIGLKVMVCLRESRMNYFVLMSSVTKYFISLKPSYIQYDYSILVDKEISNHIQV